MSQHFSECRFVTLVGLVSQSDMQLSFAILAEQNHAIARQALRLAHLDYYLHGGILAVKVMIHSEARCLAKAATHAHLRYYNLYGCTTIQ